MTNTERPGTLLQRTRELLREDTRSLPEIFRQSRIPFYWLKKFSAGEIPNPSVNRVQKLHEFLSQRKLPL